ncbi:MAG: hypothetical protein WC853_13370 [Thermodesulfovibrionales bacterium]
MKQIENKSNCRINKVEVTTDTLTGRGGMLRGRGDVANLTNL